MGFSWPLGSSTSQLSDSSLLRGAKPQGLMEVTVIAKKGMIAGMAPPEGREKAGESSNLSSSSPIGKLITGQQPTAQVNAWD